MRVEKCNTCGFLWGNTCRLFNSQVENPEEEYCSHHKRYVENCDMCGRLASKLIVSGTKLICMSCYAALGTCRACTQICGIQEDDSGLPKSVPQQIRQGNMVITTEVLNPELINKYCPSCGCYNNNNCNRNNGSCVNYADIVS